MTRNRIDRQQVLRNAGGNGSSVVNEEQRLIRDLVANASLMRSSLLNKLIDSRRDIDQECGYPKTLTTEHYKLMYDREGVATRIVSLYPEESWAVDPAVWETEDPSETAFEQAFRQLEQEFQLWAYLAKVDEISGIGRFGVLLLGLGDGKELSEPVDGIDESGAKMGKATHKLLYLRAFDESLVTVKGSEMDRRNPRFGKPTKYSISFESDALTRTSWEGELQTTVSQEQLVHWSRIIHIADNRRCSEVYGVPRMQMLFNRLYDLRKVAGGSGEMFWKGGFPGYSFEMDSNARPLTADQKTELREEVANYADGLQRYLTLQGINAKSLVPQVVSPKAHIDIQLELIAIALGVPKRVFMGSEQAQLASSQDAASWNKRVGRRQNKYLTPYVIRPTIDRLIAFGVLPEPEEYQVQWPDLESPSDKDKAEVMGKVVEAFAKYVGGNVDQLVAPETFLTMFANLEPDQVKEIMDAARQREREMEVDEEGLEEEQEAEEANEEEQQ